MFSNFKGLGDHTLSKIAEMALSNQLKAEKLKVTVKTNPESLAKGIVESLCIDSEGLVMSNDQRLQNLKMTFEEISVSPLQALVGNIKLTQPSKGTAFFVLTQGDLEHRLNAVKPDNIQQINCSILEDGNLSLDLVSDSRPVNINLKIKPRVCQLSNSIKFEDIKDQLPESVLKEAKALFNLESFQLKGFSLKIHSLAVNKGKFTVRAATEISKFPQAI